MGDGVQQPWQYYTTNIERYGTRYGARGEGGALAGISKLGMFLVPDRFRQQQQYPTQQTAHSATTAMAMMYTRPRPNKKPLSSSSSSPVALLSGGVGVADATVVVVVARSLVPAAAWYTSSVTCDQTKEAAPPYRAVSTSAVCVAHVAGERAPAVLYHRRGARAFAPTPSAPLITCTRARTHAPTAQGKKRKQRKQGVQTQQTRAAPPCSPS